MKRKGKENFEIQPQVNSVDMVDHPDLHDRSHTVIGTLDHTAGDWKLFYSDGGGDVQELTHGAADQVLTAQGATSAPTWEDAGGGTIFGSEYDYAESEGESSTTSSTYQQKLRLTTGTVAAGTYRIGWSYEFTSTTDRVDCGFNVDIDSGTLIHEVTPPPQKKSTDGSWYAISGLKHIALSNASHTIDLNYKANVDLEAGTTYIRKARLEIWRAS